FLDRRGVFERYRTQDQTLCFQNRRFHASYYAITSDSKAMKTDTHKTIYLKDYKPYSYVLTHIDLNFDLRDGHTIVTAKSKFKKTKNEPLFLNGEGLVLKKISLDGRELKVGDYEVNELGLTLPAPKADEFTLEIETLIEPEKNTRLEGL